MRCCLVQIVVSDANIAISAMGVHVVVDCGNLRRELGRSLARLHCKSVKHSWELSPAMVLPFARRCSSFVYASERNQTRSFAGDLGVVWVPRLG